jgi:hypothetical protein
MTQKQPWSVFVLAIAAGFLGGALASRVLMSQPAFAGREFTAARVIEVEKLRIVDGDGTLLIELGKGDQRRGPHIRIYGEKHSTISLGATYGKPAIQLASNAGRIMLGIQQGSPSLSLSHGGRSRTWTISKGRP